MNYLLVLINVCFAVNTVAQTSGTILYTETIQLELDLPNGIDISGMMGDEISSNKVLTFKGPESIYRNDKENQKEKKELSSDDGALKMVIKMDSPDEILYTNISTNQQFRQTEFMGRLFLIESSVKKPKWRLTNEKIKYLGYVCQKAERTEYDNNQDRDKLIVAWYTSEIPSPIGPSGYSSLPGAVLMVNIDNGKTEIKATKVSLGALAQEELNQPTKGDRVSAEEFEQIVTQKTKEMEDEFGGNGSIIIRGQ